MCTVSWLRDEHGYDLFFNRDERRTRADAEPPGVERVGSTRVIAPRDGEAGGSWVAVNDLGLTVALLNGYRASDADSPPAGGDWTSRGLLVMSLADCTGVRDLAARLEGTDLGTFRSFHLLALDPVETLLASCRDGALERTAGADIAPPLISSSYRFDAVSASRREVYASHLEEPGRSAEDSAVAFHRGHDPERGPFSPCMHREDARTVSFTWVRVDRTRVTMRYSPDSPCRSWPPTFKTWSARARVRGGSPGTSSTSR